MLRIGFVVHLALTAAVCIFCLFIYNDTGAERVAFRDAIPFIGDLKSGRELSREDILRGSDAVFFSMKHMTASVGRANAMYLWLAGYSVLNMLMIGLAFHRLGKIEAA